MRAFVVLDFFSIPSQEIGWGNISEWLILCRVGRKTLTQLINQSILTSFHWPFCHGCSRWWNTASSHGSWRQRRTFKSCSRVASACVHNVTGSNTWRGWNSEDRLQRSSHANTVWFDAVCILHGLCAAVLCTGTVHVMSLLKSLL